MFSRQHLDSPPPQSQFRRPWSPDPYDPYPSVHRNRNDVQDPHLSEENSLDSHPDYSRYPTHHLPSPLRQQRREASEVSVEALDLADYTRTLKPQAFYQADPDILDSPPSLISRGGTSSSSSHPSVRSPARRPFSLPPPTPRNSSYPSRNAPRLRSDPTITLTSPWTNQILFRINQKPTCPNFPLGPATDIYTPLPASLLDHKRKSGDVFDPNHTLRPGSYPHYPYDSYASSNGHDSNRELLPWSSDPPEYGPNIDDSLKAERIRMLEREFGPNAKSAKSAKNDDFLDENGKPLVGTVDGKGNLVTQGPKKRMTTRFLQFICACAAAIPSIYAAALIKPKTPAPPAGSVATYVLYVVSVVSLLALLFLFMIYPCCIRRKKGSGSDEVTNPFTSGMMVLPVQGLPGGKKKKEKGGKGKKGKGANMGGGDVQVNLIVDPHIFGNNREEEDEEEEEDDGAWDWEGSSVPGGWGSSSNGGAPSGSGNEQRGDGVCLSG
ncbi:hypothetical protein D9757_003642 [Collybiopsis confluens]|uniref:Uncharacterized protein n=1 Tax=Collybiopsis confluens TaxID=2823264 RepID=A0A8H5HV10_9AGAR|nr:hypothetical protein D9757_003642 [Collybiopsis confluens]